MKRAHFTTWSVYMLSPYLPGDHCLYIRKRERERDRVSIYLPDTRVIWQSVMKRSHLTTCTLITYISARQPCISAKEPYVSAKEPYVSAQEPRVSAKEPYAFRSTRIDTLADSCVSCYHIMTKCYYMLHHVYCVSLWLYILLHVCSAVVRFLHSRADHLMTKRWYTKHHVYRISLWRACAQWTHLRLRVYYAQYYCKAAMKYRDFKRAWYGLKQYLILGEG